MAVGGGDAWSFQVPGSLPPPSLLADTLYFFGDNNFTEWASLFRHYSPPPFGLLGTAPAYSFGIAGERCSGLGRSEASEGGYKMAWSPGAHNPTGAGSGVPFHWHGPGYSEVIYGRKVSTGLGLSLGAR